METETADFLMLKNKLKGKLGDQILQTLNLQAMLEKIVDIALTIVSLTKELETEDRMIVRFCLGIIINISLYDPVSMQRLVDDSKELAAF